MPNLDYKPELHVATTQHNHTPFRSGQILSTSATGHPPNASLSWLGNRTLIQHSDCRHPHCQTQDQDTLQRWCTWRKVHCSPSTAH